MRFKLKAMLGACATIMAAQTSVSVADSQKPVIASEADLPRTVYELGAPPSVMVLEGGPAFEALRTAVEDETDSLLTDYIVEDAATKRSLIGVKRAILIQRGEFKAALALGDDIRALEDKAAAKATSGLLTDAYSRAAMTAGDTSSDEFKTAFDAELRAALAVLDLDVTRDTLEATRGQFQILTTELLRGSLEGQLDQVAAQADMKVNRGIASAIVQTHGTPSLVAHKDLIVAAYSARLAAEPEAVKEDRWTPRTIQVDGGAPVIVAVWDTGVDPAVQGDRMWVNPRAGERGNAHGVAYDGNFKAEQGPLLAEAANYADEIDSLLTIVKGSLDLNAGLQTEESASFLETMSGLGADEVPAFLKKLSVTSNYIHGQHVADIAVDGIGAGQIMNVRMTWPTDPVPKDPVDEAFAEGLVAAAKDAVAFMQENDVKVVNMSWRLTRPMVEGSLLATGAETDPDARQARAAAIFDIMKTGLEDAFASAPEILFVAGAGNEDENVEFVQSVPAGLNLPNLLTVGAVDVALQPAGFTSYGASIDVYANGFEVPGRVPGGREMRLSGTSMAAPQVANLAAKIASANPDLSMSEIRALIEETSTTEGEQGLKVVHPAAALAAAGDTAD
ncbi:MAG: S8 family serine peptidase [Pseudomonadota bacterium]